MTDILTIQNSKIIDYVNILLNETEQINDHPIDLNSIHSLFKIKIKEVDFSLLIQEVKVGEQIPIRGILDLSKNVIALDINELNINRKLFSNAHEIGHFILPNHREEFYKCNENDMSFSTHLKLEMEANKFASDLLFKGDIFPKLLNDYENINFNEISSVADQFNTSFTTAARKCVENSQKPIALALYSIKNNEPILEYTITSDSFRKNYFAKIVGIPNIKDIYNKCTATSYKAPYSVEISGKVAKDKIVFNTYWYLTRLNLFGLFKPI